MKNKLIQLIFHVVFLCICFLGILDCFNVLYGERFNLDSIIYYTTLSNILCFIVTFMVLLNNYKSIKNGQIYGKNEAFLRLKYYASIIITITFIIYNFVLVDNIFSPGWNHIGNLCKHILSPILFVIDFLIFDARRRIKLSDIFISLTLPIFYLSIILFRGAILPDDFKGTIYPYFFLNYKEIGALGVLKWTLALTICFLVLASIFYIIDKIKFTKKD